MAILTKSDFDGIGDIANHCDLRKLTIAINEAEEFEMQDIFCDFWIDIVENWESEEGVWVNLINGGTYDGCNGTSKHRGIKAIWAYYAYSRYIILNGFNDTPNGMVAKTNQFSIPTPLKELQAYSEKYRNMAKSLLSRTENYLCRNKDLFSNFNTYNCAPCGCTGTCVNKGINTKGFGIKSTVIIKK